MDGNGIRRAGQVIPEILVFGFMVWLGARRRTERGGDKLILVGGLLILAVLATGLLAEYWKGI